MKKRKTIKQKLVERIRAIAVKHGLTELYSLRAENLYSTPPRCTRLPNTFSWFSAPAEGDTLLYGGMRKVASIGSPHSMSNLLKLKLIISEDKGHPGYVVDIDMEHYGSVNTNPFRSWREVDLPEDGKDGSKQ